MSESGALALSGLPMCLLGQEISYVFEGARVAQQHHAVVVGLARSPKFRARLSFDEAAP